MLKALDAFKTEMDAFASTKCPVDPMELLDSMYCLREKFLTDYKNTSMGSMSLKFQHELLDSMQTEMDRMSKLNSSISEEKCCQLLQNLTPVKDFPNLETFETEWMKIKSSYFESAKGPCMYPVFQAFADGYIFQMFKSILVKQQNEFENQLDEANGKVALKEQEISSIISREEVFKQQIESINEENAGFVTERAELKAQVTAQEDRIEELNVNFRQTSQKFQDVEIELKKEADSLQEELKEKDSMTKEIETLTSQVEKLKSENRKLDLEVSVMRTENEMMQKNSNCHCIIS